MPHSYVESCVGRERSLSVAADTYTHVLLDDRELDHTRLASGMDGTRV